MFLPPSVRWFISSRRDYSKSRQKIFTKFVGMSNSRLEFVINLQLITEICIHCA